MRESCVVRSRDVDHEEDADQKFGEALSDAFGSDSALHTFSFLLLADFLPSRLLSSLTRLAFLSARLLSYIKEPATPHPLVRPLSHGSSGSQRWSRRVQCTVNGWAHVHLLVLSGIALTAATDPFQVIPEVLRGEHDPDAAPKPAPPPARIRPFVAATDLQIVRYLVGAAVMEP